MNTGQSEVAQLLSEIEEANNAAYRALYEFASGTARHEFISTRMQRIGELGDQLLSVLGPQAIPLIVEAMEQSPSVAPST